MATQDLGAAFERGRQMPLRSVGEQAQMSEAFGRVQQQQEQQQDQQLIQQALQDGGNMNTPEGMQQMMDQLKGKVSPGTLQLMGQAQNELKSNMAKYQEQLSKQDEASIQTAMAQQDFVVQNLSEPIDEYQRIRDKQGTAAANAAWPQLRDQQIQRIQQMQSQSGRALVPPDQLQKFAQMNPAQASSALHTSKTYQQMQQRAWEIKSTQAQTQERLAAAQAHLAKGGAVTPQDTGGQPLPKAPPGFRYKETQSGTILEMIPGSPAWQKFQDKKGKASSFMGSSDDTLDRLMKAATDAKNAPGLASVTGYRGLTPAIAGGMKSTRAQALIDNLKSQVSLGALTALRAASPTGGALGNVSDRDMKILESSLAALDQKQSPEDFKKSLQTIIDYAQGTKKRLREAYKEQYQTPAGMMQEVGVSPEEFGGVVTMPEGGGAAPGGAAPGRAAPGGGGGKVVDFGSLK